MKYPCLNKNGKDTVNMQTGDDFIGRNYHITVMDNQQHDSPKKVKRFRSAFTTDQVNYLEQQFKKFPYIGNAHRKEVALALSIPERAVKIWFQNRRMKEKKENTTKEFDDEQNIRKSLEFAKDQLNNVSVPSTNGQLRSLPTLNDMSRATCDKNVITNNSKLNVTRLVSQPAETKKSGFINTGPAAAPNLVATAKAIHPPTVVVKNSYSPLDYKTSAEFSIDLCKKYKSESFGKSSFQEPKFKKEVVETKNSEPSSTGPVEQMVPEDLSRSRKPNIPTIMQPNISGNDLSGNASTNPTYVSLVPTVSPFYTQPYISASGVIWKPVSVMPVVPSSSSAISAPSNPLYSMPTVHENVTKKLCNCDCHIKQVMPQVPYNFAQPSQSTQYIITAVPFQN